MPAISVIIPVYNGEKTLEETVRSVLQQTFSDFELIIINDGSTDATLSRLETVRDPRLKVFSYPNAGLAESRNRGIAIATGEYLAFLDADDLWTADKLEKQYIALQEHPKAAVAYSWTDYIDERGQLVKPGQHTTADGDVYCQLFVNNFLENGSNPLIRKQALDEVGGFDPAINTAADWDMWLRLASRYPFVTIPQTQILYRLSTGSMSANISTQETQSLSVIERAFQRTPDVLQPWKQQSLIELYKYLTFKAIEGYPSLQNVRIATHCFGQYLRYNPALFKQPKVVLGIAYRIVKALILSSLVIWQRTHA